MALDMNNCCFVGKVSGDPKIHRNENGQVIRADITLINITRQPNANGQWVEKQNIVPIYVYGNVAEKVVEPYIKDQREIGVIARYESWQDENGNFTGFGFIAVSISLGFQPKQNYGGVNSNSNAGGPPM